MQQKKTGADYWLLFYVSLYKKDAAMGCRKNMTVKTVPRIVHRSADLPVVGLLPPLNRK